MKKVFIAIATTLIVVAIAVALESKHAGENLLIIAGLFLFLWPIIHAVKACPKQMPLYWVFINMFLGIIGYAFFLFFLFNKEKLNPSNINTSEEQT
ncbi:hypothetical protein K6Y31_00005 [Motilimonas cestriensis]|uniref:Permease n=1 Tax=Motilimonas cestriensis TaxID=2742685 RepID=A0ABS8W535_9GAMM|nr:hypothetical protein [Motilimonas cestriensis]MCE2593202.1 hypothetical protein [Motilimonas cestriensis]